MHESDFGSLYARCVVQSRIVIPNFIGHEEPNPFAQIALSNNE